MKFDRHEFVNAAKDHAMVVTFKKVDNSIRRMVCTLQPDIINPTLKGGTRNTHPEDVTPVYDLEAKGWRSFRNNSVMSVEEL